MDFSDNTAKKEDTSAKEQGGKGITWEKAKEIASKASDALAKVGASINSGTSANVGNVQALNTSVYSDERLKKIFGDSCPSECFAKIHSYVFKYKPEVQEAFGGVNGVDNDLHYGVMAQELEQNPYTASTVKEDPVTGFKSVDTAELTMANTAAISEIMRELQSIKQVVARIVSALGER